MTKKKHTPKSEMAVSRLPAGVKLLRTFEGHMGPVTSVAFNRFGGVLASGSLDNTVRLWEATSGRLIRSFEGHQDRVSSVAFDPSGGMLASGSYDNTVKLWEATSGKLLRTLEGHTRVIMIAAFSPDGRLLASKSNDDTIRLWNCTTWEVVAVISVPQGGLRYWIPALAFHPTLPHLVTAGSSPDTPEEERCRQIHLYELDYDVLLGSDRGTKSATNATAAGRVGLEKTVHSTTAKIVLVGDSGVGKTGLGWRMANTVSMTLHTGSSSGCSTNSPRLAMTVRCAKPSCGISPVSPITG